MPRGRDATAARFARRKEALKKKAQELVTRCDVEVAVLCAYPGKPLVWPSNRAVLATVRRYNALPPEEREGSTEDGADHAARQLEEELDKLVRAQESGVAGALGSWDGSLEGMSVEKLRRLLASIDDSLAAAARIRAPEPQPQSGGAPDCDSIPPGPVPADEVTEETSVSVRATGASNGAPRLLGEADEDGDLSALPHEENPTKSPNAAPLVADQIKAEGAGNGVRLPEVDAGGDALELPPEENPGATNAAPLDADNAAAGQDEGDDVQIPQPPVDADSDEAEWMRDLVDGLKEIPPPSNAAPYWSETEYLYMGRGFAIERDAYDFICFDIGMPPPYIGPDLPGSDDDEPIQLWSWE